MILIPWAESSFSNLSVTSPTSQLILQPFPRFTYATTHSPTLPLLHLRQRIFTYVIWRAAHEVIKGETLQERTRVDGHGFESSILIDLLQLRCGQDSLASVVFKMIMGKPCKNKLELKGKGSNPVFILA